MPCTCEQSGTGLYLNAASYSIQVLEGRRHYVVPMVMLTEGVHAGSNGPVFYSTNELTRSVPYWNGKPIVVKHPGQSYAGRPEVWESQRVGTVFNTRMDKTKLVAEAWIDIEKAKTVDPRIGEAIQSKRNMEVSTGLSFPLNQVFGTFNNKEYHSKAEHLIPDHLALLPDSKGACSIDDGCGLVRNSVQDDDPLLPVSWDYGDRKPLSWDYGPPPSEEGDQSTTADDNGPLRSPHWKY